MSLIQILSYSQKKEFENPPFLDEKNRDDLFTLPLQLHQELGNFENDSNRIAFIAIYGFFLVQILQINGFRDDFWDLEAKPV